VFVLLLSLLLTSQIAILRSASFAQPPRRSSVQITDIPKGQIVEKQICLNDATQSYALYLPSGYTPARQWPILYAFDPGARGKNPLEHFKDAAEKYGWIVVGSNNSRNGAFQPSVDAWNAIVKDTHDRFAIDDARIYLAGLSGGARLAIYLATRCRGCAAGVIASGAGFPDGVTPSPALRFAIFMTTGVDDFNFPEVKALDDELAKTSVTHQIKVFLGRHEWPPSSVAMEVLEWMELQAMKSGKRDRDNALIDQLWESKLKTARELEVSKKVYDAYQIYLGLNDSFKGLRDIGDIDKKLSQLRDSREVKDAIRDEQQQIRKQRELENQAVSLIAASVQHNSNQTSGGQSGGGSGADRNDESLDPDTRLHAMLADLRKQSARPEDTGERRVARRVLEGLFIGLSEQGRGFLQSEKRYRDAAQTFKLATEVNPERAGAFFNLAWAYAASGDKKKSLQALKTAVDKGFRDLAAITDNKAFDSIRNDPQYQQVIEIVKGKL
jgi:dienelactone hydrolase